MERLHGSGWFAAPDAIFDPENGLRATDQAVLLYLYRCAGPGGCAWPSYRTIQEATKLSRPTVIASIKRLIEAGWIVCEKRQTEDGASTSNVYHLRLPVRGGKVVNQFDHPVNDVDQGSQVTLPGVVKKFDQGGKVDLPEGLPKEGLPSEGLPIEGHPPSEESSLRSDSSVSPHGERQLPIRPDRVVELWNEVCGDILPRVMRLTDSRKRKIRARLRAAPAGEVRDEAWWRALFERVRASSFLTGQVPPKPGKSGSWCADFDWIIESEDKIARILEGRYDDQRQRRVQEAKPRSGLDAELAALDEYLGDSPEAERIAERMAANGNRIAAIWLERRRAARGERAATG